MRLRRTIAPVGAMILVGSMLGGCQKSEDQAAPKPATADVAHGKQIFLTLCATCHGPEGAGVKGLGKNLVAAGYHCANRHFARDRCLGSKLKRAAHRRRQGETHRPPAYPRPAPLSATSR